MSSFQNPQLFPHTSATDFNHKIINVFAGILRSNFAGEFSAIKEIHLETGIDCRSIENWYQARNAPCPMHLLILAHHIPDIIEAFLSLAGREEVWEGYQAYLKIRSESKKPDRKSGYGDRNDPINEPIKFRHTEELNERQIWFLEELRQDRAMKIKDIMGWWRITQSTAKRDIAGLVALKFIRFTGSKKTGRYEVL